MLTEIVGDIDTHDDAARRQQLLGDKTGPPPAVCAAASWRLGIRNIRSEWARTYRSSASASGYAARMRLPAWAQAVHDSPYGRIEVRWSRDDERLDLHVTVPPGTTAEVTLPDGARRVLGPGEHRVGPEAQA